MSQDVHIRLLTKLEIEIKKGIITHGFWKCKDCNEKRSFQLYNASEIEITTEYRLENKYIDLMIVEKANSMPLIGIELYHKGKINKTKEKVIQQSGIPIIEIRSKELRETFQEKLSELPIYRKWNLKEHCACFRGIEKRLYKYVSKKIEKNTLHEIPKKELLIPEQIKVTIDYIEMQLDTLVMDSNSKFIYCNIWNNYHCYKCDHPNIILECKEYTHITISYIEDHLLGKYLKKINPDFYSDFSYTARTNYFANHCNKCKALLGDHYIREWTLEESLDAPQKYPEEIKILISQ